MMRNRRAHVRKQACVAPGAGHRRLAYELHLSIDVYMMMHKRLVTQRDTFSAAAQRVYLKGIIVYKSIRLNRAFHDGAGSRQAAAYVYGSLLLTGCKAP